MSVSNYYSEEGHGPHNISSSGIELESGITLPNAKLAFKTQGTLNPAKDNVILFPHLWSEHRSRWRFSSARTAHQSQEVLHHPAGPVRQRLLVLAQQHASAFRWRRIPERHYRRRCARAASPAQRALRHRAPGARPRMVDGRRADLRMGGPLSRHGKRALPFAGTAKTTPHDYIFVRSHEDALKSDPAWNGGFYKHQSDVHVGLRRHAQIWSVMGLCPDFYNKEAWRGSASLRWRIFCIGSGKHFAPMTPTT